MYYRSLLGATYILISMSSGHAEVVNVGTTYVVQEENALDAIQRAASQINLNKTLSQQNIETSYSAQRIRLPRAVKNNVRRYFPYYTLETGLTDDRGNTIYPKGFRYNPLDYFFMPGRIVFIGDQEEDISWVSKNRKPGDQIITAGGDVRKLSQQHSITAFFFVEKMRERLGVERVPCIVEQVGNYFQITEVQLVGSVK